MRTRTKAEWEAFIRELAIRVRRLRSQRGLTQHDVLIATGISRTTYQRLERGHAEEGQTLTPTLRVTLALAQVFDVSLDELLPKPWPDFRVR